MDRERELDNLNIMRENGLISEETYQAQRRALLGTSMVRAKLEQVQKRLHPLSLLNAFKFSIRPAVFGANFIFLFVTVVFFLISIVVLFSSLEVAARSMMFLKPDTFLLSGLILGISAAVLLIFWESIFVAFFSRVALEQLERDYPPFEWKSFVLKGVSLCGVWIVFMAAMVGFSIGFVFCVSKLDLWTFEAWKRYTIGLSLFVVFISIVLGLWYVQTAFMTACVGSVKHWKQTVVRTLKRPLLILFAFGCLIINGVVIYLLGKGFEYVKKPLKDMLERVTDDILMASGLSVFGIYLVLAIVSFLVYIRLSQRGKFWFKASFLFVIPSFVILISLLSVFPVMSSMVPTSFYFAYFLVMHLAWFCLYCTTFVVVQQMAFFAHILTQVWCHVTHDRAGNLVFQSQEDKKPIEMPQPKQEEEEYQVPEVFR